ncbi:MAG: endo alpha-1,4 polygalactosaminidase [Marinobacter sp.]|uniref:endo alpha-1,4 polygalactosaminidase n=1 Tax=Marinobacter sp. TaxID=50741 RepID=UPI00299CE1A7|nr:endo alpha-1,4 polygalactosaminidase [Marinobacter sp.]MDX1635062.1 endo alpha-1,4 polygalactosaminidase [Marinobacter sp.]
MIRLLLIIFILSLAATVSRAEPVQNVGFYYGSAAPIGTLMVYDWLVLQQDQVSDSRLDLLNEAGVTPISYISIGEMARSHRDFSQLQPEWLIGSNTAWDSRVLDLRQEAVRRFILERLVSPAMARGFRGVFLDTMDSFMLTEAGKRQPDAFASAQHELLSSIRAQFPQARILLNRGFHLPEASQGLADALAFESYRQGYDAGQKRFRPVPEADRAWLDQQLARWRQAHPGMPLIAIDYLPDATGAETLASQLRADGFIPYVTDPDLERLGPTWPARVPHHVLVLHDLAPERMDQSMAHRQGGRLLEFLGYVPHYHSTRDPLPDEPTDDRYAGILAWWETGQRSPGVCRWLAQQQAAGVPVMMMGQPSGDPACQTVMAGSGMATPTFPVTIAADHKSVGAFEGKRLPRVANTALPVGGQNTPWLTVTGAEGRRHYAVYTHDGGGVALTPYLFEPGPDDTLFWLFDPLAFLAEALGNRNLPALDTTSSSGRRILTAHIDGDALISRAELPGAPLAGKVIMEEILRAFPVPHTVSVIEAEVSPRGLHPETSTGAEALARSLFALDHVEVASHTYSHPFFWQPLEGGTAPPQEATLYGYGLNIPGYRPKLEREILGSISYINGRLTPPGKPVSVFLWSGDARPGVEALRLVREAGIINVNGGDTHPLPYESELAGVWPDARPVGDELQVYAPVMNENVYTGLWTGPFYGYRNVIDTFKLLEAKGRLKPLSIYYHFYSGTKAESLQALREVYQYATRQPVTPLYLSDYAARVQLRYRSTLTRDESGGYRWHGAGYPHSVRIAPQQYPDLDASTGVAGFHDAAGNRYVHLTGPEPRLVLADSASAGPYLRDANATLTGWQRQRQDDRWRLTLGFKGHVPLEFHLGGTTGCRSSAAIQARHRDGGVTVMLPQKRVTGLTLECN